MWTCKHVHDGAVVGTLVVVVLMPISLAMDNGEFDSNGSGGGGGSGSGHQRWHSMVVEGGGHPMAAATFDSDRGGSYE